LPTIGAETTKVEAEALPNSQVKLTFFGVVRITGIPPGQEQEVSWRWIRSDGASALLQTRKFYSSGPSGQAISDTWRLIPRLGVSYWQAVEVVKPYHLVSNRTYYNLPGTTEALIVELTNEKRQSVGGCAPVQLDARLLIAALAHSQDLANHPGLYGAPPPSGRPAYSGHYGSDGSLGWDENGITGRITTAMGSAGFEGENVAYGYSTAEIAFDSWFNEAPPNDGHRRNILNCNFKLIGVGIAEAFDGTRYYTQDFFG